MQFTCATFTTHSAIWTFNGEQLPQNAKFITHSNKSVLIIENVVKRSEGTYECMAKVPQKNKENKVYFAASALLHLISK